MSETREAHATKRLEDVFSDLAESWVVNEDEAKRYEAERERERRRENLENVGGVITDADIERIVWDRVDTHAAHIVRYFLRRSQAPDGPRFLWLAGNLGRGKTVAACLAIAMIRGRYVTADQLWLAHAAKTTEAKDLRHFMRHCRLLVVDDIGTEREPGNKHALHQLVNDRQGKRRLTIFTGNGTREQVRASIDPRTLARIEHQGGIVECKGGNMRRAGR